MGLVSLVKEDQRLMIMFFAFQIYNVIVLNGAGVLIESGGGIFGGGSSKIPGNVVPGQSKTDAFILQVSQAFLDVSDLILFDIVICREKEAFL